MKRRIVFLIALILMPCVILASCRSAGMEDAQIDAFLEILNQPDQELA